MTTTRPWAAAITQGQEEALQTWLAEGVPPDFPVILEMGLGSRLPGVIHLLMEVFPAWQASHRRVDLAPLWRAALAGHPAGRRSGRGRGFPLRSSVPWQQAEGLQDEGVFEGDLAQVVVAARGAGVALAHVGP